MEAETAGVACEPGKLPGIFERSPLKIEFPTNNASNCKGPPLGRAPRGMVVGARRLPDGKKVRGLQDLVRVFPAEFFHNAYK